MSSELLNKEPAIESNLSELPEDADAHLLKTPEELADRYIFEKELGQGSQGCVYLAKRISDGTQVAVKRLNIESVESFKNYDLFLREASVLASLKIDGVAKLIEGPDSTNSKASSLYIIQEYIPGKTLEEYYKTESMSQKDVYRFVLSMLDILDALHHHAPPVIHRDLKPGNIIMRPNDRGGVDPCIIDFGAVANPEKLNNGSTVAGTFGYMPPEQLMGRVTPACDTYALAAIAVYLLSGIHPVDMEIADDLRLVIEPHLLTTPEPVKKTLRDMLSPNLGQRVSNISELKKRFEAFLQNTTIPEKANQTPKTAQTSKTAQTPKKNQPSEIAQTPKTAQTSKKNQPSEIAQTLKENQPSENESIENDDIDEEEDILKVARAVVITALILLLILTRILY